MTYVFDTNILFSSLYNSQFDLFVKKNYRKPANDLIISAITVGELKALSLKRNWGFKRKDQLLKLISEFIVHPVKMKSILDNYSILDAYSQGKLRGKSLPPRMTSRNMGKNDLWIAATAYTIDAELITTDKDFDHLDKEFLKLNRIDINQFT